MTKKILITIIYIVALLFLAPTETEAANFGLSISPPLLRIHIKPGKSITQVFKIENLSATEKTLVASVVPFTEADNNGNPILNPKATTPWLSYFSLANSKIKLDEPFSIAADSSEQLIVSLTIPDTASLQDIYATLMVTTYENSLEQSFQGTSVRATIGSNMLITISSQAYPDTVLKVTDFLPISGTYLKVGNIYFMDSITPIKFSASVSNEGSFAAETKGVFRVTTASNKPVYLDGVLPLNVIAKSKRQLQNTNGDSFVYSPSLGQIGPHQISIEIKTDNSNTSGTINVFFFPLKLFLGLIVSVFIILTIVKTTAKITTNSIDNPSPK